MSDVLKQIKAALFEALDAAYVEIARLQEAKRRALAVADERAKEANGLRQRHDELVKALQEADRFMTYFAGEEPYHFVGPGTPTSCLAQIRAVLAAEQLVQEHGKD